MFYKLAFPTRFLTLALVILLSLSWHSGEIEATASPLNKPVAQTGFSLSTQLTVKTVLPSLTLPAPQTTPTQTPLPVLETTPKDSGAFQRFVESVVDGQPGVLRGVYVKDVLALKVIQQPADDQLFVSGDRGIATQFQRAAENGVTGILAHNYLSGELFFQLESGQQVQLVYGDGRIARYTVSEILRFQKLQPTNPRSRYIDLSTGEEQSTEQVFNRVYSGNDLVTFQTCIRKGDEWSWGLIFVIATPTE